MVIFECQLPAESSFYELTSNKEKIADIDGVFKKAFPQMSIQYDNFRHKIIVDCLESKITFTDQHYSSLSFDSINPNQQTVYASDCPAYNKLKSKINPRLFLHTEVNLRYYILEIPYKKDKELENNAIARAIDEIIVFCKRNNIKKIVIKHPYGSNGKSNYFIDVSDRNAESEIKDAIEAMQYTRYGTSNYLLIEEEKIYPSISRKTGDEKENFRTYRILGIVTEMGFLNQFILSKNLSKSVDSHKRHSLKVYMDPIDRPYNAVEVGPKDKYYGIGKDAIAINQDILNRVGQSLFTLLFTDNKTIIKRWEEKIAEQASQYEAYKASIETKDNPTSPSLFFKPGENLRRDDDNKNKQTPIYSMQR